MPDIQDEWTTLAETGEQPEIRVYVAQPAGQEPCPAVIVIHEAFGLDEHIQDVTRRFAGEGFVAVAPDLFWLDPFGRTVRPEEILRIMGMRSSLPPERRGDPTALAETVSALPGEEANRLREVMAWQARRDMAALVSPVDRVIAWTRQQGSTTDTVGAVGYCFGGGLVLRLAFAGSDLNAASPYYGQSPPLDQVGNVRCPLLLMYGRQDPFIMPGVPGLLGALQEAGLDFGMHIYENAGHAVLNNTRPQMYNAAAAQDAWQKTVNFFHQHLGRKGS